MRKVISKSISILILCKRYKAVFAEPALKNAKFDERYQFMRKGYFTLDKDTSESRMVFNRTVTLKDSWKPATPKGA